MRILLVLLCAACGGAAATSPAGPGTAAGGRRVLTPKEIAELALPSVVLIKAGDSLGTGFVVWKDGRIVTNLHVIAGAREATVTLQDGKQFAEVEVMAADAVHDLAVIRIRAKDLPVLPLGDSKAVKPGEHVVAIGHPLGLGNTVSDGLVSAIREAAPQVWVLQISVPVSEGSSGGPLFNERGEVVGVVTRYVTQGQNLNFAMPSAYIKPMLLEEKPISLETLSQVIATSLLDGCTNDELKDSAASILGAIQAGVPLWNKGDHAACASIYEKTSIELVSRLKTCPRVRETLIQAIALGKQSATPTDKGWALRHGFDRILNALQAAINRTGGGSP